MNLSQERCTACRPGSPPVTAEEVAELRAQVPAWAQIERDGVPQLERVFRFEGADAAQAFVARLRALADEQDHHPVLRAAGSEVAVRWWTHAIRNLHRNDFIMAARTDRLFEEMAGARQ